MPHNFVDSAQLPLQHKIQKPIAADCREVRIIVPSIAPDSSDPRKTSVEGAARITRTPKVKQTPNDGDVSLTVEPRDRLVIGLGDSFTSGEGNPERPARFDGKTWADYGDGSPRSALPARAPDSTTSLQDTRAQWTDRWCHRSVYSWQIRSALDVALRDPHQSVTILPYGCSGASILGGLLSPYQEPEWTRLPHSLLVGKDGRPINPIEGSRIEIGLAYQEICKKFDPPYCPAKPTRSQFWCGSDRSQILSARHK
jgi:hypothetical protein